ncbi:MAG: chemotaxis response regulator protein-glutamate methylesterase [Spirochaetales bacterium]|nr:chemotaxis response regulator protein-glutamate methylesterase [Spirochaetales bacterium]
MKKINVLVIDDSAVVREILTTRLTEYPEINIVGSAIDPYIAREKIARNTVDVITLDIEMPRMDGLTFLKYLMKSWPIPVVVVSSLTDRKNRASLEALELGAVDIVPKPGGPYSVGEIIDIVAEKIIAASQVDFEKVKEAAKQLQRKPKHYTRFLTHIETTDKIIAVGASTGGTSALEILFKSFTKSFPPTLAVIHMPEKFTCTFAERLNSLCEVDVKEAEHNEHILPGTIYLAPGNFHMMVKAVGTEKIIKIVKAPKVFNQRPSVDVLFQSVAKNIGKNAVGVLLTGMGRDGAAGMLEMKQQGAYTVAQDEHTSIVFGMPKAAIDLGAVSTVQPLDKIAGTIADYLKR